MPAAKGINSEAGGVWRLDDAEALNRAGRWPDNTSFFRIIEYLVVAGGGGSGSNRDGGGGGGAGGLISGSFQKKPGLTLSVTIGSGGSIGVNGQNSVLDNLIAIGGGTGGNNDSPNGSSGGSGGGQGRDGCGTAGAGTPGQGFRGGNTECSGSRSAGGGGGAGQVGYDGGLDGSAIVFPIGNRSRGGDGLQSSITGVATYYAGGGGGGHAGSGFTPGGLGGGGSGNSGSAVNNNNNGQANTGGGGGGGRNSGGGSGGSGVVILALEYFTLTSVSAGLIYTLDTTSRPGYNIYKFTSGSGSITV